MPSLEQLRMLVPAYVLGALDASDRALFERGMATPAVARVLQGEIDMHSASLSTLMTPAVPVAAAPVEATPVAATAARGSSARPAVRVDTSAYREDGDAEGERPKRPTPMYATAYRMDEWEPGDAPRPNNRSQKPAKAKRTRETERHSERADRPTPRSVRVQPAADTARRSTTASPLMTAPRPVASPLTEARIAPDVDRLDLPLLEAAVDDLFSDDWSQAAPRTDDDGTVSAHADDQAGAVPAPREPVVRRPKRTRGDDGDGRSGKRAAPAPLGFGNADEDGALDDAYAPRSRRGARGRPWAMLTLGAVALAAIGIAAWQGLRASRLQERLLMQPALDAVGSATVSSATGGSAAVGSPAVGRAEGAPSLDSNATTAVAAPAGTAATVAAPTATTTAAPAPVASAPVASPDAKPASPAAPSSTIGAIPVPKDDRFATLFDAKSGLTVVALDPTAPGSTAGAQLFWNVERGTGAMHMYGLAALAADRSYTLWMLQAGRLSAVTRFRSDDKGRALVPNVPMPTSRSQVTSFAITVEPYGGSSRPTTVPILIGDLAPASQPATPAAKSTRR